MGKECAVRCISRFSKTGLAIQSNIQLDLCSVSREEFVQISSLSRAKQTGFPKEPERGY